MAGPVAIELTQAGFWAPELAGFMGTRFQYFQLCSTCPVCSLVATAGESAK